MNKFLVLLLCLVSANLAVAADSCSKETLGNRSCRSGGAIKCIKTFDIQSKSVKFVWGGVSASGLVMVNTSSPMFKKLPNYIPVPCSQSRISRIEMPSKIALN